MSIKIDQALVSAFIAGNFGLPIAHENDDFTPTAGTAHVALTVIRNRADPITMGAGGMDETTGILQAIVKYPEGAGAVPAKSKADDMLAYFTIGRVFTYSGQRVQIMSKDRGTGRNEAGWYQLILRFEFNARTLRAAA